MAAAAFCFLSENLNIVEPDFGYIYLNTKEFNVYFISFNY